MSALKFRYGLLWVAAMGVLLVINGLIWQNEQLLAEGQPIYLRLAPVDPRSLMQGDYMILRYEVSQQVPLFSDLHDVPQRGQLVLQLDEQKIATFDRLYQNGPLAEDEQLLEYHLRDGGVWLGAESFFFQEGHAEYYQAAEFAELRVTPEGQSLLVGLRGPNLEPLGPPDGE